jgi:predicted dehydrogenase
MTIRWGILSTANIGVEKVIPAIQNAKNCKVVAIASRNAEKATATAKQLEIPKSYGSYDELLADPEIDAIYNPLPNHLHVKLSIKALEAGKHVLCEKPIALDANEAKVLKKTMQKYPHLQVMEAFMFKFHPQWFKTLETINNGTIGEVKAIHSFFSYYNNDPENIRNIANIGGGALMDIGCYCIQTARYIFNAEPKRVVSLIDYDPQMKIDRISSGMLDFGNGITSSFTCATQLFPFQRVQILGTHGRIDIKIPFNAPPNHKVKTEIYTHNKTDEIFYGPHDQYTLQAEAFAKAIIEKLPLPIPFTDAVSNMKVIDALIESSQKNQWITV